MRLLIKKSAKVHESFTKGKLSNRSQIKMSNRSYSLVNVNKAYDPDAGATTILQPTFYM